MEHADARVVTVDEAQVVHLLQQHVAGVVENMRAQMITNRGVKVWPGGFPETFCTDHWRCRFKTADGSPITHWDVLDLLRQIRDLGFDFIKTEHLYTFDGVRGYSLAQGE